MWAYLTVPKVFELNGFVYFFFSNEGIPLEACHVHVRKAEKLAKVFIDPEVAIDQNFNFSAQDLGVIINTVEINKEMIRRKWNEFFCRY